MATCVRGDWPVNFDEKATVSVANLLVTFVIADGVTAMAGNGPLQESAHQFWKIVPADESVAADATTARLMSFDPPPVRHIAEGCHFLGNLHEDCIRMLAERVGAPTRPFSVLPEFHYLQAARS